MPTNGIWRVIFVFAFVGFCRAGMVFAQDCNGNSIDDAVDISTGTSSDCNGDGIPDECQSDLDTDGNGIIDSCEAVRNVTQGTTFVDLQLAIDQANEGDVLELAPIDHGVGHGNILILQRSLTLRGWDINDQDTVRATRIVSESGLSLVEDVGQSVRLQGIAPGSVSISFASFNTEIIVDRCWIEPGPSTGYGIGIVDLDGRLVINNSTIANATVGLTMDGGSTAPTIDIIQSRIVNCESGVKIDGSSFGGPNNVTPTITINHSLITVDPLSGFPSGVDVFSTELGTLSIANSIVRGPVTPDFTVAVLYGNSNLQGIVGKPGTGVIDTNPLFVDEDGPDNDLSTIEDNDYRLMVDSPCVDMGSAVFFTPDEFDLDGDGDVTEPLPLDYDGNPRVVGGVVDMGPHEYQAPPPCPADLNGDGMLDFFDVSAFLAAFSAQDQAADFTGDGQFNFFDVSAFLGSYSAGCP